MEAIEKMSKYPKAIKLKIKNPQDAPENETAKVRVIIKKRPEFKQKLQELKNVVKHPLFLDDLKEISCNIVHGGEKPLFMI